MFDPRPLNFPQYPFRIRQDESGLFIFDEIRKKFLFLTPEEWVRQHLIRYLIQEKGYPKSLIKLEGGLKLNSLQKRTDGLVFNNLGEKILLIECKAPEVRINQDTFDQIARYNIIHRVKHLLISNGLQHYCCRIEFDTQSFSYLRDIPEYSALKNV